MPKELVYKLCGKARHGFSINHSRQVELEPAVLIAVELHSLKHILAPEGPNSNQDQWGIFHWDRYEYWRDHLNQNDHMVAPTLPLNGTETSLKVCDGRHRLQALEDSGYDLIQIAVPSCQVTKIVLLLAEAKDALASRAPS